MRKPWQLLILHLLISIWIAMSTSTYPGSRVPFSKYLRWNKPCSCPSFAANYQLSNYWTQKRPSGTQGILYKIAILWLFVRTFSHMRSIQSKPSCHLAPFYNLQTSSSKRPKRACLYGGGGPHIDEVTFCGSPHLSCKRDQIIKNERLCGQAGYLTYLGSPTSM